MNEDLNVMGTARLLELARDRGVETFVFREGIPAFLRGFETSDARVL